MKKINLLVGALLLTTAVSSCKKSDVEPDAPVNLAVTTLAGSGSAGFKNATGTDALFNDPKCIASDASGNFFVTDYENNRIRKITPGGTVSTFAGSATAGSTDATGKNATFFHPYGIAVDGSGNVYVSDYGNSLIRKITAAGVVTTFIHNTTAMGLATDAYGNLYAADATANVIVKITPAGVADTLAGNPTAGFHNATGADASFDYPIALTVDASGNVYVADYTNSVIRKISTSKEVSTFAGSGALGFTDATGTLAVFANPSGITIDDAGNLYVADKNNHRIRKITLTAVVSTVAGAGIVGFYNSIGTSAFFNFPTDITIVRSSNNLYVTDNGNNAIRKINN